MYAHDLRNATEIILDVKRRVRAPGEPVHPHPLMTSGGGSAGRAAVRAAYGNRRVFEPVETHLLAASALLLCILAGLLVFVPVVLI